MSGTFPLALLVAFLPLISCLPAPRSHSAQPQFLHDTFLELKANRIRSLHARTLRNVVLPQNVLNPVGRAGLAFEPCSDDMPCQGERSCVQLADSGQGSVGVTDCAAGLCFCADQEGCDATADCLEGETCGPTGTCLSNAYVPGAIDISQTNASATLGLNLDPCESFSDCRNPRNCVQFVDGVFGECQGPNCFCVLADPSCISISECSDGESCTKREGSSTAICISEAALENGDVTEEEITEITTNQPPLPPMPPKPTPAQLPATLATKPPATEEPTTSSTQGPATVPPATTAPSTTTTEAVTEPTEAEAGSPDEPTAVEEDHAEEVAGDREPPAVLPVPEGEVESSAPTAEEGTDPPAMEEEAGPPSSGEEEMDLPTTEEPDSELFDESEAGPTPEGELPSSEEGGVVGEEEATGSPEVEDEICIGVHHLSHMSSQDLIYSSHRVARVLCDKRSSCATPGHIVLYKGVPMMMRKYCTITRCVQKIMRVNSPRYSRAARVDSRTEELSFTAFAARYGTAAEEHLLRAFVRIGL